jgi:pyrroloquinoline quinone (PQQ) biosynthesis protein C
VNVSANDLGGLSGEDFLAELDRELATSVARLEDSKMLLGLADPARARAFYVAYLREAYHFVRLTSSFTPLAARRLDPRLIELRKWILTHSAEELGHELMALDDLVVLGVDRASVERSEPGPGTIAWVSFFHYHVAIENPFCALGVLYFLEGMAKALAPRATKQIVQALAPDEKRAVTFFREHGTLDVEHVNEQRRELARDCTTGADRAAVLRTVARAGHVKRLMLDTLVP